MSRWEAATFMTIATPTNGLPEKVASACWRWINIRTVLIAAALLRLASILLVRNFLHPESWEFGEIAHKIYAGFGYTIALPGGGRAPSAYMPPGYVWVLAALLRLHGDRPMGWLILALVQAALGVLQVYIIYRTTLLLAARRVAVLTAVLIAVFPTQVYTCNEFHSINFYMPLGAAAVFFLTRYIEVTSAARDIVFAGLCTGLLMIFRAEAPALVLLFAAILLFRRGRSGLPPAVALVVIAGMCLSPWTIRNYLAFGRFVPVSDSGGYNLWIGNSPTADGSQHDRHLVASPALLRDLDRVPRDRDFEINRFNVYGRYAIRFAITQPAAEARLVVRKLAIFFIFDPEHEKGRRPVYWVPSVILSLFALWGAWRRRRQLFREDLFVVVSILFAVAVTAAVFALPRYKIVIDPFLMIYAASCIEPRLPSRSAVPDA